MLKQHLQFKLSQKLSPQQIQLMKLIQLPTQAFEQRLKQELEENPALESGKEASESEADAYDDLYDPDEGNETIQAEDINIDEYLSDDEIPDYRTQVSNYSSDDEEKTIPYAAGVSFHQHLINQLNTLYLDDQQWRVAEYLVGSMDESGYIRRPLPDIVDDLAFTQNLFVEENEVLEVLSVVQELDPAGVGARNLEECLSIQLSRKEQTETVELALQIINKSFEQFTKKHFDKLLQKHQIDAEQLKEVLQEIEKLNPKPGGAYSGNNRPIEQVVPDFSIRLVEGIWN